MRISTPLGDYDYRVERVAVRGGQLEVTGRLGDWETTTVVERADLLALARRAAPALVVAGAVTIAAVRRRRV